MTRITARTGRGARRVAAVATGIALAVTLAACAPTAGGASGSGDSGSASDIAAALKTKSTITVWGWAPQVAPAAKAFEKKYPNVTVKVVNAGTGNDEYTKLQNAVKAGSGAPDVAQVEYYAVPQFALPGSLTDLSKFGMSDLESKFTASTWGSVNVNGGLYGLPQDSGPMALFYDKTVFDKYGLTVPTTWDEYVEDAKKLHAADPKEYITNDTGDAGFTTSMIWQAGGHPYTVKGKSDVTIDLADPGAAKWTKTWNQLVDGGLVAPTSSWSDEWFQSLSDGSIATLIIGAWMPGNLEAQAPTGSGQWRVAPLPQYSAGETASAENGGSADVVMSQSKNKLVAAGFVQFMNEDPAGVKIGIDTGGFPSTTAELASDSFLSEAPAYFGGQKINEVFAQSAKDVVKGWQYLPFQVYANSVFNDTVGQSYANKTDLAQGLAAWQKASADYGNGQGFTVTSK